MQSSYGSPRNHLPPLSAPKPKQPSGHTSYRSSKAAIAAILLTGLLFLFAITTCIILIGKMPLAAENKLLRSSTVLVQAPLRENAITSNIVESTIKVSAPLNLNPPLLAEKQAPRPLLGDTVRVASLSTGQPNTSMTAAVAADMLQPV